MKNIIAELLIAGLLFHLCESFVLLEQEKIEQSRGVYWPKGIKLVGPGYGWDYLTGQVSGYPLINITFNDGITTNDEKYIVPDCFVVEDRKLANFYDTSDVIESSYDYSEVTSKSVSMSASANVGIGIFSGSASASFSENFKDMMTEQTRSKTVTLRTQYFDHRYTLMVNSDCKLNGGFESFVLEIAKLLKNNDVDWAKYLAQELVRDYGTHYIKKASVGGLYYKDDYISSEYWFKSENHYSDMKFEASMSFQVGFYGGAGASYSQSQMRNETITQEYQRNTKITKAQAIGGRFKPGDLVTDWAPTIDDNLAIVDKEVDIISALITYYNFQDIERIYLGKTRQLVDDTIKEYFQKNTIRGCLNRRSVNFHPYSNFHVPEMCHEEYIFGAFYEIKKECQVESCQQVRTYKVNNFLTNDVTCPTGHTPIVHKFDIPGIELYEFAECKGEPGFEKSPLLFGGIYSAYLDDNPATGSKSCPPGFRAYPLVQGQANLCLSRSYDDSVAYALPFMGFLSTCDAKQIINLTCPGTYERHYVTSYNGCYLYYCTRVKNYQPIPISKPPYVAMPQKNYKSPPIDSSL